MTKEAPMPNVETVLRVRGLGLVRHSRFVIHSSFAILVSSFARSATSNALYS
jgi:hypothetical protein